MPKIYFTADTHCNHTNVLKYCARPFASIDERNRELIARWNAVVGPEDTVYHLGDFAMGKPSEWPTFLRQLNGVRKILIRGSHAAAARAARRRDRLKAGRQRYRSRPTQDTLRVWR